MVSRLLRRRWRVQYGSNEKLRYNIGIIYRITSWLHGSCAASKKWRGVRAALVMQYESYYYNDDNKNNEYLGITYVYIYIYIYIIIYNIIIDVVAAVMYIVQLQCSLRGPWKRVVKAKRGRRRPWIFLVYLRNYPRRVIIIIINNIMHLRRCTTYVHNENR